MKLDRIISIDEHGKMDPFNRAVLVDFFRNHLGQRLHLVCKPPTRSIKFNSYYWVAIVEPTRIGLLQAGKEYSKEQVHDWFKRTFWPIPANVYTDPSGEEIIEYSTKGMTQEDFYNYVMNIRTSELIRTGIGVHLESKDQYQERTGQVIRGWKIYEEAA